MVSAAVLSIVVARRRLKQHVRLKVNRSATRVAVVDEWAWRKGTKFGTIVVDLERRRFDAPQSRRSSALVPDACIAGHVESICRSAAPWGPIPVRPPNSGRSRHGAGRRR